MKESAIGCLFHNEVSDARKMTEREREVLDKMSEAYDKLTAVLETNQIELLKKFINERENLSCEEIEFYYTQGFKLGLRLGVESMEE